MFGRTRFGGNGNDISGLWSSERSVERLIPKRLIPTENSVDCSTSITPRRTGRRWLVRSTAAGAIGCHRYGVAKRRAVLATVLLTCGVTVSSAVGAPPAKVALTGGRIIPVVGDEIATGTVLIEYGKITAVGTNVEIPYDAMEVDVSGKVVFPGMIDPHSARALDVPNENLPVTPFLDVYDAIDPSRLYLEDALRDGITAIHVIVANNCVIGGLSRVVHPIGLTPDEMTIAAPTALKISVTPKRGFDRMTQIAKLRETFLELDDYLDKLAEEKYEESLEEKDEKIDVGPEEAIKRGHELIEPTDYDDQHRNLVKLTRGDMSSFIYCRSAGDVGHAVRIAKDNGFFDRSVFVLGHASYKAVGEVKASGRPVVLDAQLVHRERDPLTGKLSETFVPKVFADAGVMFALQPNPNASLAERYLNYQASRCVRNGVSRQTALESITINPAKMLDLGDRLGSIEVGKVANVLVLTGDPLDFNTWVDEVYINGIRAYRRDDDVRLKQLLGDEPPEVAEEGDEAKGSEQEDVERPGKNDKAESPGKSHSPGDAADDKSDEKPAENAPGGDEEGGSVAP